MTSGASATNSAAYLRKRSASPAPQRIVDPHVAAVGPAQLLQPLHERCQTGLTFVHRPRQAREHADAPHPLALLRARRERPRRRRAAEQRDELAALSFDHLVGASEQRRRHVEAECLGGLEIDRPVRTWSAPAPANRPVSRP